MRMTPSSKKTQSQRSNNNVTLGLFILLSLVGLVGYFLWTVIHELSHYFMAKVLIGAKLTSFKPWPHMEEPMGFTWGSVRMVWKNGPTSQQDAMIWLAPRIPDFIAAVALPFMTLLPLHYPFWVASMVCACGLVDFGNGSIGWGLWSDSKRAAISLDISVWWFRLFGFLCVSISVLAWVIFSIHRW